MIKFETKIKNNYSNLSTGTDNEQNNKEFSTSFHIRKTVRNKKVMNTKKNITSRLVGTK